MHIRKPSCDACPLNTQPRVWGVGPLDARILVVMEAPGMHEEREGVPLVGPTGWRFDALLRSNGIERDAIRIENAMQCKAKPSSAKGRAALACCGPSLNDVLGAMPLLEVVFAFGDAALQEVSGYRASLLANKQAERSNARTLKQWLVARRKHQRATEMYAKHAAAWEQRLNKWIAKLEASITKGKPTRVAPPTFKRDDLGAAPERPALIAVPPVVGYKSASKARGSCLKLAI